MYLERLAELSWWEDAVAPRLHAGTTRDGVTEATTAAIVASHDLRCRRLGELLPGLAACDGPPSQRLTSVRAYNILRRCSKDTWAELSERSADDLTTWPNAGRKVVAEIVNATVGAWVADGRAGESVDSSTGTPRSVPDQEPCAPPAPLHRRMQDALHRFLAEAYRAGAEDIREAIELAAGTDPSTPVATSWNDVASLRLDEALGLAIDLERAWQTLLDCEDRELRILEARTFALRRQVTLGELGEELGVTRERIRQIEKRRKDDISARFATDACAPISHLAARLRSRLGSIAPAGAVDAALRDAVQDGSARAPLRRGVLLELAGPYRLENELWQIGTELTDLKASLAARTDEPWTREEIEKLLEWAGVAPSHRESCLNALPLREYDERILVWTGSMADKAYRVLRVHGEPMSREELHEAIGSDANFRSMINQIKAEARFRRMGLNSYGLTEWGGEEYTTIADEIEQAIERRGGRAKLDDLVTELVEMFGVAAQSVWSYAGSRRFMRQPDGTLAVAPDGRTAVNIVRVPAELDRDLVRHNDVWTVRVRVDRDVLRGSGRPVRTAIAQAAGVSPGAARTISLRSGTAELTWRGNQPAFGSTRALVEALGCSEGDILFVPLRDNEDAFAVFRHELTAVSGLGRVARELGLPSRAGLPQIAIAVGLPAVATTADVKARLRARRQPDLEALVPNGDDSRDDDLLDELIGLGE